MKRQVDVLLSPAELPVLAAQPLADTACVVFDILRATTTLVTALHHGARQITVVNEIPEALALRRQHPDWLLAGERDGRRILRAQTGSVDFDFGNSPREFTTDRVRDRCLVMTTTNGTRALRACAGAPLVLAAALLNLTATARFLEQQAVSRLWLVCAGTGNAPSAEDAMAAGALLELLPETTWERGSDACLLAAALARRLSPDPARALAETRNGRRLSQIPELQPDVAVCAQRDTHKGIVRVLDGVARLL